MSTLMSWPLMRAVMSEAEIVSSQPAISDRAVRRSLATCWLVRLRWLLSTRLRFTEADSAWEV